MDSLFRLFCTHIIHIWIDDAFWLSDGKRLDCSDRMRRTYKMSLHLASHMKMKRHTHTHIGSVSLSKCSQKCFRFHFGVILSALELDAGHAMLITVITAHKTTQSQKKAHYTSHRTWYKFNEATMSLVFFFAKIRVYCVNPLIAVEGKTAQIIMI